MTEAVRLVCVGDKSAAPPNYPVCASGSPVCGWNCGRWANVEGLYSASIDGGVAGRRESTGWSRGLPPQQSTFQSQPSLNHLRWVRPLAASRFASSSPYGLTTSGGYRGIQRQGRHSPGAVVGVAFCNSGGFSLDLRKSSNLVMAANLCWGVGYSAWSFGCWHGQQFLGGWAVCRLTFTYLQSSMLISESRS